MARLVLEGARLFDPEQGLDSVGTIVVDADRGVILGVHPGESAVASAEGDVVERLEGRWVVPGLVDLRVALRDPGFEHKETLETGLAAAAAGGFTAVCALPDTSPIVDSGEVVSALSMRAAKVEGARLWQVGAATAGLDDETLAPIGELQEAGCVAVTQGERPIGSARLMRCALEYAGTFGLPVISSALEPTLGGICDEGIWSTRLGLPATPAVAERIAVERDLGLAELTGCRLHLTRVSTAGAVDAIARAKDRGVSVTCDVAVHHLHLTAASLATYDPSFKVWPPLRSEVDVTALRQALEAGVIDAVTSDHQPHHGEDKRCEFAIAATGVSGLESALPMVLKLVRSGHLSEARAVAALSTGPRAALGAPSVGLREGSVADLTVIDPEASWLFDAGRMRSKGKSSPFIGAVMGGRAAATMVGGRFVYRADRQEEI